MFLVGAKDDGLLEAVSTLLQELRDLPRHHFRAPVDDQRAVEVPDVVDAVLDLLALAVELTYFRAVALHVAIDVDLDHLVGREEAVANALLQGVGVYGLPEVGDVGHVFCFFRCRGEADLRGRGEVFQYLAPCRIVGGTAPVAFIDHDQIEEAGRKLPVDFLVFLWPGDRLVESEIDFKGRINEVLLVEGLRHVDLVAIVALDGPGMFRQLGHRPAEGAEIVHHGLVDQHVAVGKEQDALLASRLPQPPDDLKCGVGFARAGGHDEQDAVLALGDGLDGGVDGVDLVIARRLAAAVVVIVLEDDLFGFGVEAFPGPVAGP